MSWHQKFQISAQAVAWDDAYSQPNYNTFIWELQKARLRQIFARLQKAKPTLRHLDFACGTGRVMLGVEDFVSQSVGIDVSPQMITRARAKLPCAEFRHGDILANADLLDGQYDVITAFRFFLNADPEVRTPVLRLLGQHLSGEHARLIFNIHSNVFSYLGLRNALLPLPNEQSMSFASVCRHIEEAGLAIESWYGFGIFPFRRLHSTWLSRWLQKSDSWAAQRGWLRRVSGDLLFVCRVPETVISPVP